MKINIGMNNIKEIYLQKEGKTVNEMKVHLKKDKVYIMY